MLCTNASAARARPARFASRGRHAAEPSCAARACATTSCSGAGQRMRAASSMCIAPASSTSPSSPPIAITDMNDTPHWRVPVLPGHQVGEWSTRRRARSASDKRGPGDRISIARSFSNSIADGVKSRHVQPQADIFSARRRAKFFELATPRAMQIQDAANASSVPENQPSTASTAERGRKPRAPAALRSPFNNHRARGRAACLSGCAHGLHRGVSARLDPDLPFRRMPCTGCPSRSPGRGARCARVAGGARRPRTRTRGATGGSARTQKPVRASGSAGTNGSGGRCTSTIRSASASASARATHPRGGALGVSKSASAPLNESARPSSHRAGSNASGSSKTAASRFAAASSSASGRPVASVHAAPSARAKSRGASSVTAESASGGSTRACSSKNARGSRAHALPQRRRRARVLGAQPRERARHEVRDRHAARVEPRARGERDEVERRRRAGRRRRRRRLGRRAPQPRARGRRSTSPRARAPSSSAVHSAPAPGARPPAQARGGAARARVLGEVLEVVEVAGEVLAKERRVHARASPRARRRPRRACRAPRPRRSRTTRPRPRARRRARRDRTRGSP